MIEPGALSHLLQSKGKAAFNKPDVEQPKRRHWSFCGKRSRDVNKLIAGPKVFICDECVGQCVDILANESSRSVE